VIGQPRARKQLAAILDGHWRIAQGVDTWQPGGVLLGGPTGTGKSMTARLMCERLGLPFAETDATRYAEVTYKGLQLPQMFIPLIREAGRMIDARKAELADGEQSLTPEWAPKSDKDGEDSIFKRDDIDEVVALAQTGVVLLDEFDKWMGRVNHVTGQQETQIQSELLKMLEGSHEFVTATDDEVGTPFDTHHVLIICAGAFVRLYNIVRGRLHEDADPRQQMMDDHFWESIAPEDFEKFGLLPELAGRLSRHIFTRPLREEHMRQILTQPGGILEYYRRRYEACGVKWGLDDASVTHMISVAMQYRTGARALSFVAHRMLGSDALYDALTADTQMVVRLPVNATKARLEVWRDNA
jgi:ATP-dependent Clp protease ATP-binding subunit ClpX